MDSKIRFDAAENRIFESISVHLMHTERKMDKIPPKDDPHFLSLFDSTPFLVFQQLALCCCAGGEKSSKQKEHQSSRSVGEPIVIDESHKKYREKNGP